MVKYAIMKDTGEFITELTVGNKRFRVVDCIEKAMLYTNQWVANDTLTAMKFHFEHEIQHFRVVQVEIKYQIKEL